MYIQSLERIEDLIHVFDSQNYICDKDIAVPVFISLKLGKPLLVEGEPGCGKTELAKVLAEAMGTELIRLQCYEGLDVNTAVYEWDYVSYPRLKPVGFLLPRPDSIPDHSERRPTSARPFL